MLNKIPVPEDPIEENKDTIMDLFFEVAKLRQEVKEVKGRVEVMELLLDLLLLDPKINIKKN